MAYGADGAFGYHAGSLFKRCDIAVAEVDHVDHAGCFRCRRHFGREGVVGAQRLFAQNMFSRGNQRHGSGVVHAVWRHHGGCVEFRVFDCVGERKETSLNAMPVAERIQRIGARIHPGNHVNARYACIGLGMRLAHAAGADEEHPYRFVGLFHRKFSVISESPVRPDCAVWRRAR